MQGWTIGKRLILGLGSVMALIGALGVFATLRLTTIATHMSVLASQVMPGTVLNGRLDSLTRDQQTWLLKHLSARSPAELSQAEEASARLTDETGQVFAEYERTLTASGRRNDYENIAPLRERFRRARDQVFSLNRAGKRDEALTAVSNEFEPAFVEYREAIQAVQRWNAGFGQQVATQGDADTRFGTVALLGGILAIAVLTICIGFLVLRTVGHALGLAATELRDHSEQIASAAGQVATSAQSLSEGATEQAATLEETSASMEEMASMTRKNAENATQAAVLVTDVARQMTDSNAALGKMVSSMAAIRESSASVAKIIKTIDEIAFQTNILALNAAVEAARAGEAGMGFAVVADEVRNLAQRSARAARDTAGLIEESIARSQEGSGKVEEVATAIRAIAANVTTVKGIVEEVRESSRQQSQGIDQVTQAVAQMEKVTQITAATAEESAAASEELSAQAEGSMAVVRRLEGLVGTQALPRVAVRHSAAHGRERRRLPPISRPAPRRAMVRTVSQAEQIFPLAETGTDGRF